MPKVEKSGLFLINIFRYKINFQLPSLGVLVPILVLCKSMESRYLFRSRFFRFKCNLVISQDIQ